MLGIQLFFIFFQITCDLMFLITVKILLVFGQSLAGLVKAKDVFCL